MKNEEHKTDLQKRKQIIKTLAVGGLAVTAWHKPITNSVILPAHAQTTGMENTGTARLLYEYVNPDTQTKVEEAAPFSYRLSKIDTTTGDFEIEITGTTPTTASLTPGTKALDYFIRPAIGQATTGILLISRGRMGGNVLLTTTNTGTATGEIILTSDGNVGGLGTGTACTVRLSFELTYNRDSGMLEYGDNPFTVTGGSCNVFPSHFPGGLTVEFIEIVHVINLQPTPITVIPTTDAAPTTTTAPADTGNPCLASEVIPGQPPGSGPTHETGEHNHFPGLGHTDCRDDHTH